MQSAQIIAKKVENLQHLEDYTCQNLNPEPALDALTRLAAHLIQAPMAFISFFDKNTQHIKSHYGCQSHVISQEALFYAQQVKAGQTVYIPNIHHDPSNEADGSKIAFYMGMPLRTKKNHIIGTLSLMDYRPREIAPDQQDMLQLLSEQTMSQIELRYQSHLLEAYQRFFNLSLDLFCTSDGRFFDLLNPSWERVLGWSTEELRNRPFLEFVHPDDNKITDVVARQLQRDGAQVVDFENRYRNKAGEWVVLSWRTVYSEGKLFAAARDMTAYHQAHAKVEHSELQLRSIIDTAMDVILSINEEGIIKQTNAAIEKLFSYTQAEILGIHIQRLMPTLELPGDFFKDTPKIRREIAARRKDGSMLPVELTISTLPKERQNASHWVVVVRDISERVEADRIKQEFISTVSHELRTPLTSIRGALGLVAGGITGELPPRAKQYINIALSNTERLVRLVNDMLDFDKMTDGKIEFRTQEMDLVDICQRAITASDVQASLQGLRLSWEQSTQTRMVWADPDRSMQVISNLLSNAIKFSPPGTEIAVHLSNTGHRLRVEVRDQGPGIPEAFQSRIFQRFAQADNSDARATGGSGLGLAISKSIIEKMGGIIGFSNAETRGAIFYFELPILHMPSVRPPPQIEGMEKLRNTYAAQLPGKLQEIERLISTAAVDAEKYLALKDILHKLQGTAASFGFSKVGQAAARMGQLIETGIENNTAELQKILALAKHELQDTTLPKMQSVGLLHRPLLIVDDDPDFLKMILCIQGHSLGGFVIASTQEEALKVAEKTRFSGVLLDVHLAQDISFDLARQIRDTRLNGDIPIAFVSGDARLETRVAAVAAGGIRFLEKPLGADSLVLLAQQFENLSYENKGRVLIVDQDPEIQKCCTAWLSSVGMSVDVLDSTGALDRGLEESSPDVLLLGGELPDISGIDVCRALRQAERWETIPILMMTTHSDDQTRLAAFRAGASDVISKPLLSDELIARVKGKIEHVRLLRARAEIDPLSGLLLRRPLVTGLQRELALAERAWKPLSIALIDLDRFKSINDSYGHVVGDQVIAGLGELLRRRFRVSDLRGRWGGEEFVLVLPGMEANFAEEAIKLLLKEFMTLRFKSEVGILFSASFSAGIACYPTDGATMEQLLGHADRMLYRAKEVGRCCVIRQIHTPALDQRSTP